MIKSSPSGYRNLTTSLCDPTHETETLFLYNSIKTATHSVFFEGETNKLLTLQLENNFPFCYDKNVLVIHKTAVWLLPEHKVHWSQGELSSNRFTYHLLKNNSPTLNIQLICLVLSHK